MIRRHAMAKITKYQIIWTQKSTGASGVCGKVYDKSSDAETVAKGMGKREPDYTYTVEPLEVDAD